MRTKVLLDEDTYVNLFEGKRCPVCESNLIGSHTLDCLNLEGMYLKVPVFCSECEATWEDVFALVSYINLQTPETETPATEIETIINLLKKYGKVEIVQGEFDWDEIPPEGAYVRFWRGVCPEADAGPTRAILIALPGV